MLDKLQSVVDGICDEFEAKNAVRESTLRLSRQVIRHCANSIRASHRDDFAQAQQLLTTARKSINEMVTGTAEYPEFYHTGYTLDALKELSEAHITYALITDEPLPTPDDLNVPSSAYLNGLAEAMGEMRRYVLDRLRRGDVSTGERLLNTMDDVYSLLVTVDFPDAITSGLRRNTDMVRGVLERTRGDLTTAVRQETMKATLQSLSDKLGLKTDE